MTNTLNATALELIAVFAKANKVSRAKVTELGEQLVATVPYVEVTHRTMGRKASETVLVLRKMMEERKDEVVEMTAKDVAAKFGVSAVEANNTLRFFEKSGLFTRVGMKDKEPGTRGKREVIWTAVH